MWCGPHTILILDLALCISCYVRGFAYSWYIARCCLLRGWPVVGLTASILQATSPSLHLGFGSVQKKEDETDFQTASWQRPNL